MTTPVVLDLKSQTSMSRRCKTSSKAMAVSMCSLITPE